MVEQNRFGSFGAKFSAIKTPSFSLRITTAKKSLLGGLSTVIWDDSSGGGSVPLVHAEYPGGTAKAKRYNIHDEITNKLDQKGESGLDLKSALSDVLEEYRMLGKII